jgi:GntR family transcriptional regulator
VNFNLVIATGSSAPIYKQITDQVRLALAAGKLSVGDRLPSVRALAEDLVVNPNTVARAYADLSRDGLLETRSGRGVFIARKRRVFTREEAWRRLEPLLDSLIGEALSLDFTPDQLRDAFSKKIARWKEAGETSQSHE